MKSQMLDIVTSEKKVKICQTNNGILNGYFKKLKKDFTKKRMIYLMLLPLLVYYIIFHYWPMYGSVIAFKDFSPAKGIWGSQWIGFTNFIDFFNSFYFIRNLLNTLILSFYSLVFGFPAPILLALLLNEVKNDHFKRTVQTVTYIPHFISVIVICGIIVDFTSSRGIITDLIVGLGGERVNLLTRPELFRPIYVMSGIWQEVGWNAIVYLAALASIDIQLYEAAKMDGAGRFRQMWHITLPGIMPTIVILLILKLGGLMNVAFEKILLLYNPLTYSTSDVIATFVYRQGILGADYSYSTAVGLFNSAVNFILIVLANRISRKLSENSLW